MSYFHVPVLAEEVGQALTFKRPVTLVDGTLGLGGHSSELLRRNPQARVLGLDWDPEALRLARERLAEFSDRFEAVEASYADLSEVLEARGLKNVDGVLLDLGLSSLQLADAARGFSFLKPGPLDMRMSPKLPRTAWDLLNELDESALARLFQRYGEEPAARRIAGELKQRLARRSLPHDAYEIAKVIRAVASGRRRVDPATQCFQALRIAVNHELENVDRILELMPAILAPGGRAAIIAFHSLEDRLVKQAFAQAAKGCVCPPQAPACVCGKKPWAKLVSRKAIKPTLEEIHENPRARSARLRVLERLEG